MKNKHDGSLLKLSWKWKQPGLHDFLNQKENKGRPISKFRSWSKTNKNMTHVKHVSNKILLQKKKKKGYDKKRHQKLVLNKLKVMGNCVFIYTHWAPSSNFF